MMTDPRQIDRAFNRISFLIFSILGFLIYSNVLCAGFQFDDYAGIVDDPYIRNILDLRSILNAFNTRFLLGLSFALNFALGKASPFGFHSLNIIFHILSAYLLYRLVRLMVKTPIMEGRLTLWNERSVAFAAALIFLAHPIQTQAVSYIWQRSASMATFFYLSALFFYARFRQTEKSFFYVATLLSGVAAMFTKEIAFTWPFAAALYEFLFIRDPRFDKKKSVLILLPFFLTLLIIPLMLTRAHEVTLEVMRPEAGLTRFVGENVMKRGEYLLTQVNVVRTYFRLFFFPVGQNLDYDYPIARGLLEPGTFFSLIFLAAIFFSAFLLIKKLPMAAFGIFWIFLTMSVESLVVQSDVIFEHRMYLPMIGFCIASTSVAQAVLKKPKHLLIAASIVALVFSSATYLRNRVWQNDYTLWRDVISKSPQKYRGFSNLALAYERDKDYGKAIENFRKAIDRAPGEAMERYNLGLVYLKKGDYPDAVQAFTKAIELQSQYDKAYNNLGVANIMLGRNEKALECFVKAVQINPHFSGAYRNLARFYRDRGDHEKAQSYLEVAEQLNFSAVDSE